MIELLRAPRLWRRRLNGTAQRPADHGPVAHLPNGTSASVWSHGGATNSISCRVLELVQGDPRLIKHEGIGFNLAVPDTGQTCEKPWIARLSDTEFVATWERVVTATGAATIEAARIYQDELGQWAVDQQTSGSVGWVIETGLDAGAADCNCRVRFYRNGYALVRYSTETADGGAGNPHTRTYTVKHGLIRWISTDLTGPVGVGSKVYANQHWDDDDLTPTIAGGYMIGETWPLNDGNVLSVWENRVVNGANFDSSLRYRILAGLAHATPLTEIATGTIKSVTGSDVLAYRRPRLAGLHPHINLGVRTDPATDGEKILLTYGEEDVTAVNTNRAKLAEIIYGAGAAVSVQDINWRANRDAGGALEKIGSSCVIVGPSLACGIAVADSDSALSRRFSVQHADGRHEWLTQGNDVPDRPSGEVWVNPDDGEEYLFLSSEGYDLNGGSATLDRYLELRKLVKS